MAIRSPCNAVCKIDETTKLCRGCARSLDEIASWGSMSDAARSAIMAELDARMLSTFGQQRRKPKA